MKRLSILLLLSGCAVGPDYQTIVDVPSIEEWADPGNASQLDICTEEPYADWWKNFNDPQLDAYIEMAACYNNHLQAAESNILIARAIKREQIANFFPQINLDNTLIRSGYSKNGPLFYIENLGTLGPAVPAIQVPFYQTLYTTLFDAAWEIDLFGKNARATEAAERELESVIESRNDILVSLLAETARNYVEVRAAQAQAELTKQNIEYVSKNLSLTEDRYRKGLDSLLDVSRSKAILENLQANLSTYEAQIYSSIFSLSILTGQDPEALLCEMLPIKPLPSPLYELCIGLKSDLLLRRPDVRRAERNLAQAVAQIGMAKASFFPSFTFLGSGGLQSLQLRNLFRARSAQWSYGFDFNIPIFEGGYLMAQYQGAQANAQSAAFEYHETVLEALRDAETSLVSYAEDLEALSYLTNSTANYKQVRDLSFNQYQSGLINLMAFLDRENDLINAELTLVSKKLQALIDLISLYKALGGGWQPCIPNRVLGQND